MSHRCNQNKNTFNPLKDKTDENSKAVLKYFGVFSPPVQENKETLGGCGLTTWVLPTISTLSCITASECVLMLSNV